MLDVSIIKSNLKNIAKYFGVQKFILKNILHLNTVFCIYLLCILCLFTRDNNFTKQNLRYKSFRISALALSITEHSNEAR